MCSCGGGRRRTIPTPTVTVPTTTRAIKPVVAAPPTPSTSNSRIRRLQRRALPPVPSFHLPVVNTAVWGSRMWTVLHVTSLTVTCGDVWMRLIQELKMGLPCPDCTVHYTAWANAQPVSATTDMAAWFLALHNDVNRRLATVSSGRKGWTCEELTAAYTGRFTDARTALDSLNGIIGADTWTTLDAILQVAAAPPPPASEETI